MTARASWSGWDGRRLSWRCDDDAETTLFLDDVPFRRFGAQRGDFDRNFPFSPSGRDELAFSVRANDAIVLAPWRVRHGKPAPPGSDQWTGASPAMLPLFPAPSTREPRDRAIAIVVPIYNSPNLVARCIASVLRWTPRGTRLILIDDASTDPHIAPLLQAHAGHPQITIHRNDANRGYTGSVNIGIALARDADVVLLNSDTEVGPRWLHGLAFAAYAAEDIATSTAVSDNAGAFSVPELEQYCPTPERWDLPTAQRAVLQNAGLRYPELPTGNGFCLYIKRRVIERIGTMDEQAFAQGYGEENDFCQRAERAGFRHVIAGNVLVRHARSASFGHERRAALGAQGMAVLRARYPDYEAKVGTTLFRFERRVLDYRVRRTYDIRDAIRPRVLVAPDAITATLPIHCEFIVVRENGSWHRADDDALIAPAGGALIEQLAATGVEAVFGERFAEAAQALDLPRFASPAAAAASFDVPTTTDRASASA
ncbi:MAG TPA: glycosyltransferase [Rudaea sp.]